MVKRIGDAQWHGAGRWGQICSHGAFYTWERPGTGAAVEPVYRFGPSIGAWLNAASPATHLREHITKFGRRIPT